MAMKTGLVLEGGAFRTIFSSGACDGLLAADIMPDYCVGVSAGIAYGVSYISKQSGRNLEILTHYANDKRYMGVNNLLRPGNHRCYFGLQFTYDTIPNELIPFDYETFAAFPGEVEAVVTNMDTGKAEYLPVPKQDEHFELLQATCALPFLFPVYHINGKPYMDGGAADAIPYDHAVEKGCDRVVVILTRERSYIRKQESLQPLIDRFYRKYPKFCDTMRRRADDYNACRGRLFRLEREGKVLIIAPKCTRGFSRTERDVEKIKALYQDGYQQAVARQEEIRAFLKG
ncbi:phospholipase, patatin family [Pseudoflavonifractor capillosus ATCC 29799]|uniref:Phospholipase, patatin family n=2 Tax=Pseudoflavonifractor capillosus TaxID=106588 RepID=A6NV66_9FIRM|nr:phospholipase, patatin family [Pseudoflavonifractor capillosus ATCC 29799]